MRRSRLLLAFLGSALVLTLGAAAGAAVALRESSSPGTSELSILLSHPHVLASGSTSVTIDPRQLRPLVRERDGEIAIDAAALAELLAPTFPDRDPRDARLRVGRERVAVVPGTAGRELDAAATAAAVLAAPARTRHAVRFRWALPDVTTPELEALGVRELVGAFTTRYPAGQPRVVNIERAAELLDGTILPPGATFSMNEALGRRTVERGFVPAPMISGGVLVDSVGGGISQVATTLYNAAFFAGLELVEHTPHSFYIDRYPMGREATISWGGPELVFRNDWEASLLMKLVATETSITVRFYSSLLGRRVETATGDPYAWTVPRIREILDPSLAPGERVVVEEPGASGFTIDYTRRVYQHERVIRDERFRWRYDPHDGVVRVGVGSMHEP
jgi:vancomycin resistance protein YoaR